jgi:hypothetical protein
MIVMMILLCIDIIWTNTLFSIVGEFSVAGYNTCQENIKGQSSASKALCQMWEGSNPVKNKMS